jgi:hypothetical protein
LAEGFLNCNTAASATGESRGKKESLQAFCRLSFWISIFETYLSLIGGF